MDNAEINKYITELISDVAYIKSKVEKMDSIERDITEIKERQSEEKQTIQHLEKRVDKLEDTNKWIIRSIGATIIVAVMGLILI